MKQPYIGNTKINKLYKGNEIWCNWVNVDVPSTFETIIFCQSNNNINQNGSWSLSSYNCYSGTKSLYSRDKLASITTNLLTLPTGTYKWSMYFYKSETCNLVFSVEGDYSAEVNINPDNLINLDFSTIMTFNITSPSNISLKLSAENAYQYKLCRFFDWKLEKIS